MGDSKRIRAINFSRARFTTWAFAIAVSFVVAGCQALLLAPVAIMQGIDSATGGTIPFYRDPYNDPPPPYGPETVDIGPVEHIGVLPAGELYTLMWRGGAVSAKAGPKAGGTYGRVSLSMWIISVRHQAGKTKAVGSEFDAEVNCGVESVAIRNVRAIPAGDYRVAMYEEAASGGSGEAATRDPGSILPTSGRNSGEGAAESQAPLTEFEIRTWNQPSLVNWQKAVSTVCG